MNRGHGGQPEPRAGWEYAGSCSTIWSTPAAPFSKMPDASFMLGGLGERAIGWFREDEHNDRHDLVPYSPDVPRLSVMRVDNNLTIDPPGQVDNILITDNGTEYTGRTTNPGTLNVGISGSRVGAKVTSNEERFHGDIAEVVVYDRLPTDRELEQIQYYLDQKWGLGIGIARPGGPVLSAPAFVALAPATLEAGAVSRSVGVTNTGTATLSFGGTVTFEGGDAGLFSNPTAPGDLAPGDSGDISFTVTPTTTGAFTTTMSVPSNDPDSPTGIVLSITVPDQDPFLDAPSAVVLDTVADTGGPVTCRIEITNSGLSRDLNITGVTFSGPGGAQFFNAVLPGPMGPGLAGFIDFDFNPAVRGANTATMEIASRLASDLEHLRNNTKSTKPGA